MLPLPYSNSNMKRQVGYYLTTGEDPNPNFSPVQISLKRRRMSACVAGDAQPRNTNGHCINIRAKNIPLPPPPLLHSLPSLKTLFLFPSRPALQPHDDLSSQSPPHSRPPTAPSPDGRSRAVGESRERGGHLRPRSEALQ